MHSRLAALLFLPFLGLMIAPCEAIAQEALSRTAFPGESMPTARRLETADKLVADGQAQTALDDYQRILEEAADDLVPVNARYSLPARTLCHLRLAALPADVLRTYRERVDGQVKKWWDQARATRDLRLLRRIVDEAFCSRYGDQALDFLGDRAFERGQFDEADYWWRHIALPASQAGERPPFTLVYPDPQVDVARVRAKMILTRLVRGDRHDFADKLQAFQTAHAQAVGWFAGKQGNYSATLQELARHPQDLTTSIEEGDWPTFAGHPARTVILPKAPRPYLWESPPWEVPLKGPGSAVPQRIMTPTEAAQTLAFHPVIAGDQVIVAGPRRIQAFDLTTGRPTGQYELPRERSPLGADREQRLTGREGAQFTLTVAGGRLLARLGGQAMTTRKVGRETGCEDSFLVCLDLRSDADEKLVLHWQVPAQDPKTGGSLFEGTPVVVEDHVLCARLSLAEGRVATTLDCYSLGSGARRWRREVCEIRHSKSQEPRYRHHLLTVAGPDVVYASHAGGIVAVDALTGRLAWAVRYPGHLGDGDDLPGPPRNAGPCVCADGRVFAAPADYDRILCLDAASGRLLWESPTIHVDQLLGVASGKLLFTSGSRPRGLRALATATGKLLRGWIQPDDGQSDLPTFGRGFLAGDQLFWPTVEGLRILNLDDGQPEVVENERLGNLAFGNGCLAVADAERLRVYVPPGRQLEQRQKDAALLRGAGSHYDLALAEFDAGRQEQALANFTRAEQLAGPADTWNGAPLRERARRWRHQILLRRADQALERKQWDVAAALARQAAAADFPLGDRLRALTHLAEKWTAVGQYERAAAVWQGILADDVLRGGPVGGGKGSPSADNLAIEHIDSLVHDHGTACYAIFEQQARALRKSAEAPTLKPVLERLFHDYPNASVTPEAMRELAGIYAKEQRFGAEARVYRAFLQRAGAGPDREQALIGLARAYRRQLQQHEPRPAQTPLRPDPVLPLLRRWEIALAPGELLLVPDGPPAAEGAPERLFFARANELLCRAADTGQLHWQTTLGGPVTWVGRHADCVLAAGPEGAFSLSVADCRLNWQFRPPSAPTSADAIEPAFDGFHLVGSHLYLVQGRRRLFALDADTGRIQWSQWAPGARIRPPAPGGCFNPLYYAGARAVVAQTQAGGRLLVIDAESGRCLHELDTNDLPWHQTPRELDRDHLGLVSDARHVARFDLVAGKDAWTCASEAPGMNLQAPQLLGDGEALFRLLDGCYMECLDPASGTVRCGFALATAPVTVEQTALDASALYYVSRGILYARARANGKPLWSLPLDGPAGPWRLVCTPHSLFVFPAQDPRQARWSPFFGDDPLTFPFMGTAPLVIPFAVDVQDFPVVICDPAGGRLVQRLVFAAAAGESALQFLRHGLVVARAGKAWGLFGEE
jgi:outer membrane protein assembly factor BamB/tetratricopeptide (TPR) repeat protein